MTNVSEHYIAVPPGATLKEQIKERGMTQNELADRLGLSTKHVSQLINGNVELTKDVALRLETVLGLPASFWNNLEVLYREQKARVEQEQTMEGEKILLEGFPYKALADMGWLEAARKIEDKILNLRRYFAVANLSLISGIRTQEALFRQLKRTDGMDLGTLAWVEQTRKRAEAEAEGGEVPPFNRQRLSEVLDEMRGYSRLAPEAFQPLLRQNLAMCGVILVVLPSVPGSGIHGVSYYDRSHKRIVLGLTTRGKDADRFWFSLFHELGHIMLGHLDEKDSLELGPVEYEEAADCFARTTLIPDAAYQVFKDDRTAYIAEDVTAFADEVGVAPGIVVGRLQKEGYVPYNQLNELKVRYELT